MCEYVKASKAARYYNISESNLRLWAREGRIPVKKSITGRYQYFIPIKSAGTSSNSASGRNPNQLSPRIIYARVSSRHQQHDLERQIVWLQQKYPEYTLVTDIGSGINYKRKGFQTILEHLFSGNIEEVVVAHQDRFSRFGFDLFEWIFSKFKAKLICLEQHDNYEEDIIGDIMEIFTVFSARYYGKRKYGKCETDINDENTNIPVKDTEGTV
jgi:predicted site-specific integrase-resolvase